MRFNIKEMKMQGIFLGVLAIVLAVIIVVPTVIGSSPKDEPIEDTPTISDKGEDGNTDGTSKGEDNKNEATTHTHQWVSGISVEPTCTEKGYTINTCTCKESKLTNVHDPLGHKFGEWTVVTEPTTEAEGLHEHKCSVCGETESEKLDKLGTGFTPDDDPNVDGGNENPDGSGDGGNENPDGSGDGGNENPDGSGDGGNENPDGSGDGGNENPDGSGNENQDPSGNEGDENSEGNGPTE